MKTKTMKMKVKADDFEHIVSVKNRFGWNLVNDERINDKKIRCTFQRGPETVTNKKGLKKVKLLESCYFQLEGKKVPVAPIILTLITGALIALYFVIQIPIVQVLMIGLFSLFGAVTIFIWLAYIMGISRKKKLLNDCINEAQKYLLNPSEIAPINTNKKVNDNSKDVMEGYLQDK